MEDKVSTSQNNTNNKKQSIVRRNYDFDESVNSIVSNSTPTKAARSDKNKTPQKGTPVRKIIKRLFVCSASKKKKPKTSSVLSTSSSEEYRGYPLNGHCSASSSPSHPRNLASLDLGTVTETATTHSAQTIPTALSKEDESVLPSPPRKEKVSSMKDPTAIPLPDSPVGARKSQPLMHEILPASPENVEELFLPEESSSSGSDGPSPISTPTHHSLAMRSPGMAIPTPQNRPTLAEEDKAVVFPHPLRTISESPKVEAGHSVNQSIDEDAFLPDDFKHSMRNYTWEEVQRYVRDAEVQLREHLEDRHQHMMEELQEEAEKSLHEHGSQWKVDTEREFQRMENTLKEEKAKTQQKHMELINKVTEMSDMRQQIENFSLEREEYESHIASLEAQLRERSNTGPATGKDLQRQELDREFLELQEQMKMLREHEQMGSLETLKNEHNKQLQEIQRKYEASEKRAKELQRELESMKQSMIRSPSRTADLREQEERHQEELRHLQASKEEANQQVLALQDQLNMLQSQGKSSATEDLIVLKAENSAAQRKITDLQDQIDSRTEEKHAVQASLREAYAEIEALKQDIEQLRTENANPLDISMSSDVSQEELFAARAEVEALRLLRQDDEKKMKAQLQSIIGERDALKSHLKKITQKYQIELGSPRRRGRESTVNIHAMTVEVGPSPRNDKSGLANSEHQAEDRLKILGQNFAKLQKEKDALEEELQKAKENHSESIEKAYQEAKDQAEKEIRALRDEIERKEKEHEAEKRSIRADLSVAEIAELTAEVQNLKSRHQDELNQLRKQVASEIDTAIQIERENAENIKRRFEEEKAKIEAPYKQKISELEAKIKDIRDEHEEELEVVRSKSKEEAELELAILQNELRKLRIEFEGEKIEIIKSSAKEQDDLLGRLDRIRESNRAEVEAARAQARERMKNEMKVLEEALDEANRKVQHLEEIEKKCDDYETQVDSLKKELSESKSMRARVSQQYIEEMQAKFEEDLEREKEKAQDEIAALRKSLEISTADKKKLLTRLQVLASKLDEADEIHQQKLDMVRKESQEAMDKELEALEETIKMMEMGDSDAARKAKQLQEENDSLRIEYDIRVQKLHEEHTKEIDEMLTQLDLVEAEHKEKYDQKEKIVHEKDAVITALGSQLAEAQSRLASVAESQETFQKELEDLTDQLAQSRAETAARNEDINRLIAEHRQAMEDQEILREQACEEAKEEMIKLAEVQFEQRNEHYKKLKHEFDNAVSKIASLETELKATKAEAAEAKKRQEALEIDLADELAQAKAATAASDLNAARKIKQFRTELEESKAIEAELRRKLEEAKTTSQSIQSAFAGLVSEKEKLLKENQDLTAVCEELMAEIETQSGK